MKEIDVKETVKKKYGSAALNIIETGTSCCGSGTTECSPITSNIYEPGTEEGVPQEAFLASLGCGNPTAVASLQSGETVLDLGSGGGIDVFLSAQRVGPSGFVYGLDMTDEMLQLARDNQRKAGVENVEFLKGEIEEIPLPDRSVDVVISNCVINLSANKDRVLKEAFRVLRPGGRFAVSDVVVRGTVPENIRKSVELWAGCVAGALSDQEYISKLERVGFEGIELEPIRVFYSEDVDQFLGQAGIDLASIAKEVDGKYASAIIRARKPDHTTL
jgi:ubiquinone/menaquinone biosynthesis C-methylase UbiE